MTYRSLCIVRNKDVFHRYPCIHNVFSIEHHDTTINLHFHKGTLAMSRSELLPQSQEFHIWNKVRRHQLAAQQDRKGLKELRSCHSICPQSLTILSLSSAYFHVWRSNVGDSIKQDAKVGSSQIHSLCCQHNLCQQEAPFTWVAAKGVFSHLNKSIGSSVCTSISKLLFYFLSRTYIHNNPLYILFAEISEEDL